MSDQYIRKWSLILTTGSAGLDLSQLRIRFRVTQGDTEAPGTAAIRVYNLAPSTANAVEKEYQRVVLQAGYENGNYAVIFQGTIKQIVRGRESALESFVDIFAADGDEAYNFAVVNASIAAGSTLVDRVKAIAEPMSDKGVTLDSGAEDALQKTLAPTGGTLPRGKVLFGMSRAALADVVTSGACTWSIQNGKIVVIPLTGYLPGEAVVLSAETGLIGVPEATVDGMRIKCLLNPLIRIGTRVKIDNAAINLTTIRSQGFPRYSDLSFVASPARDGVYRVLVVEFTGDSHGQEWYGDIVALAIDPSTAPDKSVAAYG